MKRKKNCSSFFSCLILFWQNTYTNFWQAKSGEKGICKTESLKMETEWELHDVERKSFWAFANKKWKKGCGSERDHDYNFMDSFL